MSRTGADEKEAAFREIFDKHYPELCRRLLPYLGDRTSVEDVVQEAFVRLYFKPPAHRKNIAAWLFRVAVNLAYNHARAEERRRKREYRVCLGTSDIREDEVLRREEIAQVRETLARMAPRDRFCLLLRFQGYGYAEIAAVLKVDKSSVGTILARARERFRREFTGWEKR
ncbi:MAG: sigma-70 family RNA polymerase sigma factor [Bacillota bacterium]